MTPNRRIPIAFIVLFFITWKLFATGATSETGPRHVASAWTIYKGGLYLNGQGRFYTKHETFTGANQIESGVTYWDSQISSSLYWGLTNHVQFGLTPILSQKYHTPKEGSDVPGDLLMNIKLGSIGPQSGAFGLALQLDARVPIGEHHNIPLHPYSADAVGFGGTGIVSFSPQLKTSSKFSFDVNAGYFNHNDADLKVSSSLADSFFVEAATQELTVATAARWTGKKIGLFAELHGRFFLQQPPETVYTRENVIYFSPGLVYQFNPWIQVIAGADILINGLDDETIYEIDGAPVLEKPWDTVPNMPDWRFNFGLSFRLKEGTPPQPKEKKKDESKARAKVEKVEDDKVDDAGPSKKDEKRDKKEKERDMLELEKRLRDQQKTPVVESEEERQGRIEAERQRMLEVLEELRKAMEEREQEEARQREEQLRKAEEQRLQREQEAEAARQDSLLKARAMQDSLAADVLPDSLTGETVPDSLNAELPAGEAPPDSIDSQSTPQKKGENVPTLQPDEQRVETDSTLNQDDAPEVPLDGAGDGQEAVPDSTEQQPELENDPPPEEGMVEENYDPPEDNPNDPDPDTETPPK